VTDDDDDDDGDNDNNDDKKMPYNWNPFRWFKPDDNPLHFNKISKPEKIKSS
jgi:hypothetical protein